MDSPLIGMTADQARQFAGAFGLSPAILPRCSTLFCLELASWHYADGINPHVITDEILVMEGIDRRARGTKKPERFRHDALRGLMKKHFFSAHFLPVNLQRAWESGSLERIIWDGLDPANAPEGEDQVEHARRVSMEIARRAVHESFLDRQRSRKVTGEWIIYAPHADGNRYVCLATHHAGDDVIREKIVRMCLGEFPFLREVLRVESG